MSKSFRFFLLILALGVTVPFLIYQYTRLRLANAKLYSCQVSLLQIGMCIAQYSKDYGGNFPVARPGWGGAIQPYMRTADCGCMSDPNPPFFLVKGGVSGLYNSYWFNGNLFGVSRSALAFPGATLLLGEGNDGTDVKDATYHKTSLPPNWLTDESKPCWRHRGGGNYLYTDGHVAWQKPDQVTANFGRANCFAGK